MSLINDALRRAGQEKKKNSSEPAGGAPMEPIHRAAESDSSSFPFLWILIVGVLIAAGWFFLKGSSSSPQNVIATTNHVSTSVVSNPPVAEQSPSPRETNAAPSAVETDSLVANPSDQTEAASATEPTPVPTVEAPPPPPPPLKLQGIIFRVKNATAMINGKSLVVGESVSGARVTKIEREQVTLERDGQILVLKLQ